MTDRDDDPLERPYARLSHWAIFGAGIAQSHEEGVACVDLHHDNLGRLPKFGNIVILDRGRNGFAKIGYPKDWDLLPSALLALLPELPSPDAAAFRFGFIHHGGPVSQLIFDTLRRDYRYVALVPASGFRYEFPQAVDAVTKQSADLKKKHSSWVKLRDALPFCRLESIGMDQGEDLASLTRWRAARASVRQAPDRLADEAHYRKHLVAAYRWGSALHQLEALMNLAVVYEARNDWLRRIGLVRYCAAMCKRLGPAIPNELTESVMQAEQSCASGAPQGVVQRIPQLPPLALSAFHYLWLLDDCELGQYSELSTPQAEAGVDA
jgi:hypothetical protein